MLLKMHELVPFGDRMDNPSPGPRPLVKAPVAGHPLPWGEGNTRLQRTPFLTSRIAAFGYAQNDMSS
jgi:hypothetical protein